MNHLLTFYEKIIFTNPLETGIPEAVAKLALLNDYSALRAWREHLGLTQAEVASRLGISQLLIHNTKIHRPCVKALALK